MPELVLSTILSYLIGLAANLRTDEILGKQKKKQKAALKKQEQQFFALNSMESLHKRLEETASETGRLVGLLPIGEAEKNALVGILANQFFQDDLAKWLSFWDLPQSAEAQSRLEEQLKSRFASFGVSPEKALLFVSNFFNMAETVVFADPIIARWRHQLSLNALRQDHKEVLRRMRERDGEYEQARLDEALHNYREAALKAHDIIDLHGMPEEERQLAMQDFVLRQLYIPLRVQAQPVAEQSEAATEEETLEAWEQARSARRLRAAGRGNLLNNDNEAGKDDRRAIGELLDSHRRIVVLADPGGGKTTLMRWFATAYLLRLKHDSAFNDLPDVATLPKYDWLPILIRCRELPNDPHICAFDDLLIAHINQMLISEQDRNVLKTLFRQHLEAGTALLMVDGLDEIQDPKLRARFSRRLETLATLFNRAPILVTSRVVGYREMPFRLGHSFIHTTITDLTPEEMDEFAHRWIAATEPENRRNEARQDLIQNIHSTKRVERLAGNPMLLTTLALVHRKVGRLPQKRHELYREALKVLLNWRGEIDERLDWYEAVPQLEYIAYAMCRDGLQQIPRSRVLDLIEEMRAIHGTRVRDVNNRTPQEFLELLERRSSLLIEAGSIQEDGHSVPVYEFRHLTFQEYLAALALVNGRFPGHDKKIRFSERVAPLAAICDARSRKGEIMTSESWREPLRLCLAECNPDDVDDALLAIVCPANGEDHAKTARPRAMMAALCLADEPNVDDSTALMVLRALASQVGGGDGNGRVASALDIAAMELARSCWGNQLRIFLLEEFISRPNVARSMPGGLSGMIGVYRMPESATERARWMANQVEVMQSDDHLGAVGAALDVMNAAYEGKAIIVPHLFDALIKLLYHSEPAANAAAWALGWLALGGRRTKGAVYKPTADQISELSKFYAVLDSKLDTHRWLSMVLAE